MARTEATCRERPPSTLPAPCPLTATITPPSCTPGPTLATLGLTHATTTPPLMVGHTITTITIPATVQVVVTPIVTAVAYILTTGHHRPQRAPITLTGSDGPEATSGKMPIFPRIIVHYFAIPLVQ